MKILNLTQHNATPEQVAAGVIEPTPEVKARIRELLTFNELPAPGEIAARAEELARIAAEAEAEAAMIGGAPYLMSALERALIEEGVEPLYAFSRREIVEEKTEGGEVRKVSIFRHLGFVSPPLN